MAAAAGFSPISISGCVLWLRADLGITLNGSNVSAWADQSGTGDANKNVAQASAPSQPTYTSSSANYNNEPIISDTVSIKLLKSGTWASPMTQPATIYAAGNMGTGRLFDGDTAAGGRMAILSSTNKWSMFAGTAILEGTTASSTRSVACAVFNGASSALYVTDPNTAQVTGNPGTNGFARLGILDTWDGMGGGTEELAELIIYSGAHTATQRSQVMSYMRARYGL